MEKIKIFNHFWHLAHQYSLYQLPFAEFYVCRQYRRPYSAHPRGDFVNEFPNVHEVNYYEEGKYDVAILHLDQQCIEESLLERGKGKLYRQMNETIKDIPKIVIMHGTTYYPEKFSREAVVQKVKELVGDNVMVTNAKQCAKDFGFGTPIWHGIEASEWYADLPKEPRAVTMISPAGLDKYYDREYLEAIREELEERGISHCHITVDWRAKDWEDYKQFLGRSLIYLNPTFDSPMPRARTEAMLSGCCVITTPHQDADTFIKDGENGFIMPRNPKWVADKVEYLIQNYDEAVKVGQAGRKTAEELFNMEQYFESWRKLLSEVTGKEINHE